MTFLRKKWILLAFLSFLNPFNVYAGIEDEYRRQQEDGECSFENAQFIGKDYKYCVSGGFWKEFNSYGSSYSEGVLNRSLKNVGLYGSNTIRKFKIEGDDLVRYSCKGTFDAFDFDCIGPVDRKVMASRGRKGVINQMNRKFSQTSDKSIAYNNRGIAKSKIGDYSDAIDDFTNAIKIDSNNSVIYTNSAFAKESLGDYQGAINDYNTAIEKDPDDSYAYYARGLSKEKLGNINGAKIDFTKAIEIDPNYESAYDHRGLLKGKTGDFAGAVSDFTKAIKINPNKADYFYNRGLAKAYSEDFYSAIDDFSVSIKLDPFSGDSYTNRALSNLKLKNYVSTCSDFKKAVELGDYPRSWFLKNKKFCNKYLSR